MKDPDSGLQKMQRLSRGRISIGNRQLAIGKRKIRGLSLEQAIGKRKIRGLSLEQAIGNWQRVIAISNTNTKNSCEFV